MAEKKTSFTNTHRKMLHVRGLDPRNYELVKETYGSLYIRHKATGVIKIINKCN